MERLKTTSHREASDGRAGEVIVLGAAISAAILIRLAFVLYFPLGDCVNASYINPAKDVLIGQFATTGTLVRLPGAIYFFSFCLALFKGDTGNIVAVQHLLGFIGLCVAIEFAHEAWGRRAAVCAGVLLSFQFLFALQEHYLQSETICQLFLIGALRISLWLRQRNPIGVWPWFLGGAASAFAALTRGEYVLLGPLIAAVLMLPGGRRRKKRFLRPAVYLAAWAFFVGGWVLRNRLVFGYSGLVPDGPAVLMDTVLHIVRYDLPTQPLAKRILKEETIKLDSHTGSGWMLHPRVSTSDRLAKEFGYTFVQQRMVVSEIAREAAFTQPLRYMGLVMANARWYLAPHLWMESTEMSPNNVDPFIPEGEAQSLLWHVLSLDQYWGWIPLAAGALSLFLFPFAAAEQRWAGVLVVTVYLATWASLSLVTPELRMQSILYVPLSLAGSFACGRIWNIARARAASRPTPD
jgi:hypothetical protein